MKWKEKLRRVILQTDTKAGKRFDVVLLWMILASVLVVMLDSVPALSVIHGSYFHLFEWVFTIIFTIEYVLRVWVSKKPWKYIFSFWGLVDILSFLPAYLSIFLAGYQYLLMIRVLRLLRIFRIFKLSRYLTESRALSLALYRSIYKISLFLSIVLMVVIVIGSVMYVVEHGENGFTSIPQSVYWAIITITTVGYGDIVPHTIMGKFISAFVMLIGYAIIAVPTGIVSIEFSRVAGQQNNKACSKCASPLPETANYCPVCGERAPAEIS